MKIRFSLKRGLSPFYKQKLGSNPFYFNNQASASSGEENWDIL